MLSNRIGPSALYARPIFQRSDPLCQTAMRIHKYQPPDAMLTAAGGHVWFTARGNPRPTLAQRCTWRQSSATVHRGKRRADQGRRPLQGPEVRPRLYRVVVIDYHYRIEGAPRPPSRRTITPYLVPTPITLGILTHRRCRWRAPIRRLAASGLGICRSAPRSTSIPMSCQECRRTRWNRLTSRSGAR